MKKSLLFLAIITILLSACSFNGSSININPQAIQGSGTIKSEERPVNDFNRVVLKGIGDLTITQGTTESLTVKADENLLPYITTEVFAETLEIGVAPNINLNPSQTIEYQLTVKQLGSVVLSGFGNITADKLENPNLEVKVTGSGDITIGELSGDSLSLDLTGFGDIAANTVSVSRPTVNLTGSGDVKLGSLTAETFELTLSGFGNATVAGTAESQTITITGSGDYFGGDLQTKTSKVKISGFGDAALWTTDTVDITITGSGDVSYFGSPVTNTTLTGMGQIKSLGEH